MLERGQLEEAARAIAPVDRPPVGEVIRRGRRRRRAQLAGRAALVLLMAGAGWTAATTFSGPRGAGVAPAAPQRPDTIAFVKGDDIFVASTDGSSLENVTNSPAMEMHPTWSPDGRKIAFSRGAEDGTDRDIYVMNADGTGVTQVTTDGAPDLKPEWSPDGTTIAFVRNLGGNEEIFLMDAAGGNERQLTHHPMADSAPAWSPDGTTVAYARDYGNERSIVLHPVADDAGTNLTSGSFDNDPAWAPDGETIAFVRESLDRQHDVFVADVDGSGVTQLTDDAPSQHYVSWFPNGQRLLFFEVADINRGPYQFDVYVMNANGTGKTKVTREPLDWLPDPAPRP